MGLPKGLVTGKTAKLPASFGWMRPKEAAAAWVATSEAARRFEVALPWPPSVNHYWRRAGNHTHISTEGKRFRRDVIAILSAAKINPFTGPIAVDIDVFPPDNRRRDIDNLPKAILDAMQHGGAYEDDSQIGRLLIEKRETTKGGKVMVRIRRWEKRE